MGLSVVTSSIISEASARRGLEAVSILLYEEGIHDVYTEWHRGVTNIGRTAYNRVGKATVISLSKALWPHLSYEQRLDVIAHEVAHASLPYGHKHDSVWRRKCLELGGNGNEKDAVPDPHRWAKYSGVCPKGHTTWVQRAIKHMNERSCSHCSSRWDPANLIVWTKNY